MRSGAVLVNTASTWPAVKDLDGRPSRPVGISASSTAFRFTRSRAIARRTERFRHACVRRNMAVLNVGASPFNQPSTSRADNCRSLPAPKLRHDVPGTHDLVLGDRRLGLMCQTESQPVLDSVFHRVLVTPKRQTIGVIPEHRLQLVLQPSSSDQNRAAPHACPDRHSPPSPPRSSAADTRPNADHHRHERGAQSCRTIQGRHVLCEGRHRDQPTPTSLHRA